MSLAPVKNTLLEELISNVQSKRKIIGSLLSDRILSLGKTPQEIALHFHNIWFDSKSTLESYINNYLEGTPNFQYFRSLRYPSGPVYGETDISRLRQIFNYVHELESKQ